MISANSKRKHVTSACQPCRDSKIRCDGARPVCGNCMKKDKDCQYTAKDDKRRVSLRTAIDILSDRVAALTEVLVLHGVPVPPLDAQQELTLNDICETLKISLPDIRSHDSGDGPRENGVTISTDPVTDAGLWQDPAMVSMQNLSAPGIQPQEDVPHAQGLTGSTNDGQDCLSMSDGHLTDGPMADWPWHVFESNAFLLSDPLYPTSLEDDSLAIQRNQESTVSQQTAHDPPADLRENASSDEEHESDLVQQVSARFGALRISSDGQLRYFGAATNYHLLEGSRHDEDVDIFTTKHETLDRLGQAGLNQEIPSELEEHLLELYFAWHNPSHVTVDHDAFLAARTNQAPFAADAGYSSDFLINAICAIGAAYETRYHPTFVTYPRSLAEYFASRAKILLEADLECPTIGTVQGLCLLSSYEAARGRDARTWLYGGMAMRLCFDLGLHINCAPYVKAGILTTADVRARRNTFWSCVVLNHLSSFHFGRPFRVDSEEITVQTPSRVGDDAASENRQRDSSEAAPRETGTAVLTEWVFLCETLVPLVRKLYGSSSTPIITLQEVSSSVTQQLEIWWHGLPTPLQVQGQGKASPEILFLHMAYHHFQILIHRPWTSRRSQPWTGQGSGSRHARRTCSISASAISTLLLQYEKDYSFGRMHNYTVNIVFSAALISLFNVIACQTRHSNNAISSEATANLSIFFRALDDLGRSFDSAKRAREHLATIQRKWYLSGSPPVSGSKRHHDSSHVTHSQKRSRQATAIVSKR